MEISSSSSRGRGRGQGNSSIIWSCDSCTFHNPLDSKVCSVCQTPRQEDVMVVVDQAKQVELEHRRGHTGRRGVGTTQAKLTLTSRIDPQSVANGSNSNGSRHFSGWTCEKCTFLNVGDVTICMVCGHTNSSQNVAPPSRQESLKKRQLRQSNAPRGPVKTGVQETFDDIVSMCRTLGSSFVDDAFPPGPKSLYINGVCSTTQDGHRGQYVPTTWLRPHEITAARRTVGRSTQSWTVMSKPSPADICQGSLGNCWLMGPLSVVAERKVLLDNIIQTTEINPHGVYIIRLNHFGQWKDVIIDDLFPTDQYGRLLYATARRNQLWVSLIEKAMAKLNGSYEALIGGFNEEAFTSLTGFPCSSLRLKPDSDLDMNWVTLLSSASAGFLLGTFTSIDDRKQEAENMGLLTRHAYSVLQVHDEFGHKLLKLRNPWGNRTWTGDWSAKSKCWSAEMKKALKFNQSDAGVFWMCFDDFMKYFHTVEICRIRTNWEYNSFSGVFPPYADPTGYPCYSLSISAPTELDITLYQTSWMRSSRKSSALDAALIIVRIDNRSTDIGNQNQNWKLVAHSKRERSANVNLNPMLDPGEYMLVPVAFAHWTSNRDDDLTNETFPEFVILIHSSKVISCHRTQSPEHLLADLLIFVAMKCNDPHPYGTGLTLYHLNKGNNNDRNAFGDIGYVFVVENANPNHWLQIELDARGCENLGTTRGILDTVDCIPPRSRQIIHIFTQFESSKSYLLSYNIRLSQIKVPNPNGASWWSQMLVGLTSGQDNNHTHEKHIPQLGRKLYGLHAPRPIN